MKLSEVLIIGVLGMAIVFAVLLILMGMIKVIAFLTKEKKVKAPVVESVAASAADAPKAPGSCGDIKLFDVPDKTAAMLMAIVADKLGEPLNTLRFISIKEVE